MSYRANHVVLAMLAHWLPSVFVVNGNQQTYGKELHSTYLYCGGVGIGAPPIGRSKIFSPSRFSGSGSRRSRRVPECIILLGSWTVHFELTNPFSQLCLSVGAKKKELTLNLPWCCQGSQRRKS